MPRKKSARGQGSIRERKTEGRWEGRIWINGERKSVYGVSEQDVRRQLTDMQGKVDAGIPVPLDRHTTLGQYIRMWLEEDVEPRTERSTYLFYKAKLELHVVPELGKIPLWKLDTATIQAHLNRKRRKGMSPAMAKHVRDTLRCALEDAVETHNLIGRNPAKKVSVPQVPERKVPVLEPEEAERLLAVAAHHRFAAIFYLCLSLGMRIGEVLGLRWEDIDFEKGRLAIEQRLLRQEREWRVGPPKKNSKGTVDLPALTAEALRTHRVRYLEEKLVAGDSWEDWGLAFVDAWGRPLYDTQVRKVFQKILAAADLPANMHVHDLRHSCSSLLQRNGGVGIKVAMELLRHKDIRTTLRYTHATPPQLRDAADRMNALLSPKDANATESQLREAAERMDALLTPKRRVGPRKRRIS